MTGTSINLKSALRCIDYIREHIDALEERITDALGPEATTVDTITDFERLLKHKPGSMFGPHMSAELLRGLWKKDIIYHWTYRDHKFDISPIKDASEKGFYLVGPEGVNSFVTFNQCVCDAVDYDELIWDMMEAKVVGFADGCLSAKRKLSEDPRLKEAVEEKVEDLKWRDGYDNATAVKCEFLKPSVDDIIGEGRLGPVGHPDPAGEPSYAVDPNEPGRAQCDGTYYGD